ncbi:hypothetical protein [Thiohalobacter thiocyanaticus]|nr:hypothetical protein [Thiohalobacter thiocyanaticus]
MATTTKDLGELREGMVLGADVSSPRGQMLLAAGATLTDRHLRLLAANGVARVEVDTAGDDAAQPTGPALNPAQLEARLETRFAHNDPAHPLIRELKRICRSRNEGGETDGD